MSDTVSRQCRRVREWLPEYAEGRLSGGPRAAVEQHLAACVRCTQEVADLRAMLAALHAIPAELPPDTLVPGVRQAVARRAAIRRRVSRPFWPRIAIPAAAATGLLAAVLGYRLMEQGYTPRSMGGAQGLRREAAAPRARPTTPVAAAPTEVTAQPSPPPAPAAQRSVRHLGAPDHRAPAGPPALAIPPPPARQEEAAKWSYGLPPRDTEQASAEKTIEPAKAALHQLRRPAVRGSEPPAPAPVTDLGRAAKEKRERAPLGALESAREAGRSRRGEPNQASVSPRRGGGRRPGRQGREGRGLEGGRSDQAAGRAFLDTPMAAKRVQAPASARALLTREGDKLALAVQLEGWPQGEQVEVKSGDRELWRGAPVGTEQIVVSLEGKDGRPQTLPITLNSPSGTRNYTLFAPPFSLLGKQSGSTVRRYSNTPISKVLADLSAKDGLVLLVEGGLDREVSGELALGTPKAAVDTLAQYAGYRVHTDDLLVYTLTPRP